MRVIETHSVHLSWPDHGAGPNPGRQFRPLSDSSERTYALFIHLSQLLTMVGFPIIVPLILWLVKKNDSAFIDDHGREVVNFIISILIYSIAAVVLVFVGVGMCIIFALPIFQIVVAIIGAVRANSGEFYRYPMTIRFIPS